MLSLLRQRRATIFAEVSIDVLVRSLRPIQAGEELTISYIDLCAATDDRRAILQDKYLFRCTCDRCGNNAHPIDTFMYTTLVPDATKVENVQQLFDDSNRASSFQSWLTFLAESQGVLHPLHLQRYRAKVHCCKIALRDPSLSPLDLIGAC